MAAPTVVFRGKATVEGSVATYDVLGTGVTAYNSSLKASQAWEDEIIKDNHGYDAMWLMRNEHATFDGDLYFAADTAAHAAAPVKAVTPVATPGSEAGSTLSNLGYPFLAPGSLIVVTTATLTGFNGTWRVLSGADASLTNTGAAKYTVKLLKYANADQQTALATIPT